MKPLWSLPVAIALVGAVIFAAGCGGGSDNPGQTLAPDAAAGKKFAEGNCMGCHTVTGANAAGPTWKGLSGSHVQLADGRTVAADDAYVVKSIVDPGADVVSGYSKTTMAQAFPPGSVSQEQARRLVAYIATLH